MPEIRLKRAYDGNSDGDGFRIYVDRIWPRGLSHESFKYELWEKQIAPTSELRHWFHEDPDNRWPEFEEKYYKELENNPDMPKLLRLISGKPVVTLIYSSKDHDKNNAVVLKSFLQKALKK